jgi:probable addiction module antidote protein
MSKLSKFDPSDYIKDDEQAGEYLKIMLDENGVEGFLRVLGHIARAKGMSSIAKETGLGRESLYKSLSENGNPKFSTVAKTLKSLNINMHFKATH